MELMEIFQQSPVASILFILTIGASWYAFRHPLKAREWMLSPSDFVHHKRYYTILTSGFIHGDLGHIIFNMMTFYFFAFPLEQVMVANAGWLGHVFFGIVYIFGMMLADTSTIWRHRNDPGYFSLGASGAITAVLFSAILFRPDMKIGLVFIPIPIPAPIFAILYIVFSVYASKKMRGNINHEAHIGGAFAGMILTTILFPGILTYFFSEIHRMIGI